MGPQEAGLIKGNGLAALPRGEQTLGGIRFRVGERLVTLGGKKNSYLPKKVDGIEVRRRIQRLYALHSTQFAMPPFVLRDGGLIGQWIKWQNVLRIWGMEEPDKHAGGQGGERCAFLVASVDGLWARSWSVF
jgi:hypothetical protein